MPAARFQHDVLGNVQADGATHLAHPARVRIDPVVWDVRDARMVDLHAACVRMVRADYCGDGTPHTRNGTKINFWDNSGVLADDPWPGMRFEAAWSPQGAVCVARTRLPEVAKGLLPPGRTLWLRSA